MQPKKEKYRKSFRGRMKGKSWRGQLLEFGEFGLKAIGRAWLTDQQIEATRKTIAHYTKRQAKVWIRVFPSKPVSARSAGVGMGGGKGDVERHVCVVTPGRILFEIGGVDRETAREALRLASHKLPFKTKFMERK